MTQPKEAAQCGVKVLAGLELGFPTIASMCGIHIINGKPTLGAHLMAAAVKRSGKYNYRVTQLDNNGCTIAFSENGETIGESSFTKQDAVAAGALDGKNAHTWKKFPRNMMFARAMSNGVRWYCPDIFTFFKRFCEDFHNFYPLIYSHPTQYRSNLGWWTPY